jgi:hypothetical protein
MSASYAARKREALTSLLMRLSERAVRVKLDRLRPQPFRSLAERHQSVFFGAIRVPRIADFSYTVVFDIVHSSAFLYLC